MVNSVGTKSSISATAADIRFIAACQNSSIEIPYSPLGFSESHPPVTSHNMSGTSTKFDPYVVLGVDKNASLTEIKTAHRKLVLKCHPDKVKEESSRAQASDVFQRVQESYELLSDDTRRRLYDSEVRLTALKKEAMARNGGYPTSKSTPSRETRDGRLYEERTPASAAFFTDSDEPRYTEEPVSYSRKYEDAGRRAHARAAEEKKKAKSVPLSTSRTTKESTRDHVKASHQDRAKHRTRERRRDASDKYERATAAYVSSDLEDGSGGERYYYVKRSDSRHRTSTRRDETEPSASRRSHRYKAEIQSDSEYEEAEHQGHRYDSKLDSQQSFLKEYISRSKEPIIEVDRRPRATRSPRTYAGYDSADHHERDSPRYGTRGHARTESTRVPATSPPRPSRRSHERFESPSRAYERSNIASSPKIPSSSRAPPPVSRSSTAPYTRTRRDGAGRSESKGMPTLASMVAGVAGLSADTMLPRSRPRAAERYDSGYSSPGTPEMPQGPSSAPKVSRYKIVDPPDRETIVVEPADARRYRSSSPPPRERSSPSSRTPLKSSRTYTYPSSTEPETRYERRPSGSSRTTSSRLFGEVRYASEIKAEDVNYAYVRPQPRRQSAY